MAFDLPDDLLRRALLQLFLRETDGSGVTLDTWVTRSAGASPAFLEELCRKALICASERQESADSATLALDDADFDQAIHELLIFGGGLTRNVLGYSEGELLVD